MERGSTRLIILTVRGIKVRVGFFPPSRSGGDFDCKAGPACDAGWSGLILAERPPVDFHGKHGHVGQSFWSGSTKPLDQAHPTTRRRQADDCAVKEVETMETMETMETEPKAKEAGEGFSCNLLTGFSFCLGGTSSGQRASDITRACKYGCRKNCRQTIKQ